MDRWVFDTTRIPGETTLASFTGCRLFDGDKKTDFKDGQLSITSHSIKFKNDSSSLCIPLKLVVLTSSTPSTWKNAAKVELQLQAWERNQKPPGPFSSSSSNIAKIEIKQKGAEEFCVKNIMDALQKRVWETRTTQMSPEGCPSVGTLFGG